jgi:hypothetical protein
MPVYYPSTYKRKSISGKLFMAHSFTPSKADAKKTAGKLRENGYNARVVRTGKVWSVYYGR